MLFVKQPFQIKIKTGTLNKMINASLKALHDSLSALDIWLHH